MAPVMSSVTVACCVRSPSATPCSSFIRRKIAAWLASLTRLASCSWRFGLEPRGSARARRAGPARSRAGAPARAPPATRRSADRTRKRRESATPVSLPSRSCTDSRPLRSGSLSAMIAACASRAAVRPCRLPRMRAGLRAGLLVQLDQRAQALACLRIARARQAQLRRCLRAGPSRVSEGVQVLAEQEHRLRAHALGGQEFVRRLADALRQHDELADRRELDRRRVALHLERRDGLGHLEHVRRLTVDRAQRLPTWVRTAC